METMAEEFLLISVHPTILFIIYSVSVPPGKLNRSSTHVPYRMKLHQNFGPHSYVGLINEYLDRIED